MHVILWMTAQSASPLFMCFLAISPAIPNIKLSMFSLLVHKIILFKLLGRAWASPTVASTTLISEFGLWCWSLWAFLCDDYWVTLTAPAPYCTLHVLLFFFTLANSEFISTVQYSTSYEVISCEIWIKDKHIRKPLNKKSRGYLDVERSKENIELEKHPSRESKDCRHIKGQLEFEKHPSRGSWDYHGEGQLELNKLPSGGKGGCWAV